MFRTGSLVTTAILGCALALPGGAFAKSAGVSGLKVTPKAPKATDSLKVSFIAGKIRADQRYDVSIQTDSLDGARCATGHAVRTSGVSRKGRRVTVTLDPSDARPVTGGVVAGRFCAGPARVRIGRANAENKLQLVASQNIKISEDTWYPQYAGTPVKITLLEGSALLVQAAGRPDRSLPVGGVLRGLLPGTFKPNTDLAISGLAGSLWLRSVTPDPLCAGATYTTELGLSAAVPAPMILKASGEATLNIGLTVDAVSLAGCPAPATPAPVTLNLAGKAGPKGLVELGLSASVAAVPIATGVTATVTANFVVGVDLSGKG